MKTNYPIGHGIGPASVRGESILAYYQTQVAGATAADLIADVLAAVECDRQVAEGEARAEGEVSTAPSARGVIEDAEGLLEDYITDFTRESSDA